jgi:hypothetical protein
LTTNWSNPNAATKLRKPGDLPKAFDPTFASEYRLDSSQVDYNLARALYYNTDQRYKLGAGFSRPAIDVPAGFMGVPILRAEDPTSEAQEWLNRSVKEWAGSIRKAHKMVMRDGEVVVRLRPKNRAPAYQALFESDDKDLELALVPTEAFEILGKEEDMDALVGIKFKHVFLVPTEGDDQGQTREVVLFETVTADQIHLKYENNEQPERILPNPLGFVPAIHLENEPELHQLHASSDLEPLEPYLKFYNDVMLHAGAASALHSTAKLIIRAQDVERFLNNNFSDADILAGKLTFKSKDILFFESGQPAINTAGGSIYAEGAEIIQASAPLGETTTLLEFIFLNIVDASEVPEWAFGGAIASSKASVTEQSAPLVHKVSRKRTMVEQVWALAGRMMLKTVLGTSERVMVEWDSLAMRDLKTEAEAFRNFAESLLALNDGQTVSKITMNNILQDILPEILPYEVDDSRVEADRISAEVAEKMEQAAALMEHRSEQLEDEDREAGLRVVGGSGGSNPE